MSDAVSAVREALVTALSAAPGLDGVAIYLMAAPEDLLPRIEVQEPAAADWSTKDWHGRELRTAVTLRVAEGQVGRLGVLRDAIEAAGEGLGGEIAGGWRVVSASFLRSRTIVERSGRRTVLIEHRLRVAHS